MNHGADTTFLIAVEIVEHERHPEALQILSKLLAKGDLVAIAPQVLAEFIHVVTDPRRFQNPISVENAITKSENWWKASEVVQVFPTETVITQFHGWMRRYGLGRKRVLDTLLAATYHAAGITSLLTLNPVDFDVFRTFGFLPARTDA